MGAVAAAATYICLSFSFMSCSLFSSPLPRFLRKSPQRGCFLHEWERATAVLGTAVGRPFSLSSHFCNDDFCYEFPKLLNRFRPFDLLPDPPDVQCADVALKRGQSLYPLGSPDGEISVFLPYTPRRPHVNDTGKLSLCLDYALLPPFPFNHSFIKAPLVAVAQAEPDDMEVLRSTREQTQIQGTDPMSRQFAEVLINIGVDQVNKQKYKDSIKTFNLIIGKAGLSAGVLIGRGTALALAGNLEEAILDYTRAIELDTQMLDGWRRRAQARTAFGEYKEAADDYSAALDLAKMKQPEVVLELLTERAMVHARRGDTYRAAKDLKAILKLAPNNAEAVQSLAQMLLQLGEAEEAAEVLVGATRAAPGNRLLWTMLGMAYRDALSFKKAKQALQTASSLDPRFAKPLQALACILFKTGDYRGALKTAEQALRVDAANVEAWYLKSSCHHLLGDFSNAVKGYDTLLSLSSMPDDQYMIFLAFYQREITAFTAMKMEQPLSEFDLNANFVAEFKEYWASRQTPTLLVPGYTMLPMYEALKYSGTFPLERGLPPGALGDRRQLAAAADSVGAWIHSLTAGVPANKRQMRAMGMAAIEVAQALRKTVQEEGGDVGKRRRSYLHDEEEDEEGGQKGDLAVYKNWKEMYDTILRWLAIGDPVTPYILLNGLRPEEFNAGFGVSSTIVNGHTKNPQYYPLLGRALGAVKEEILDSGQVLTSPDQRGYGTQRLNLDPAIGPQVEYAESCKELWQAVGEDFQIVSPCFSTARPDHILNGTNLVISQIPGDGGYNFMIRTISNPKRWRDYEREMSAAWKNMISVLSDGTAKPKKILSAALRMAYYWYNFSPLPQGSGVAGHVGLYGCILASHLEFSTKAKTGTVFEWEALLAPSFTDFKDQVQKWMVDSMRPVSENLSDLPSVKKSFPTVSSIIQMLDIYDKK